MLALTLDHCGQLRRCWIVAQYCCIQACDEMLHGMNALSCCLWCSSYPWWALRCFLEICASPRDIERDKGYIWVWGTGTAETDCAPAQPHRCFGQSGRVLSPPQTMLGWEGPVGAGAFSAAAGSAVCVILTWLSGFVVGIHAATLEGLWLFSAYRFPAGEVVSLASRPAPSSCCSSPRRVPS